MFGSRRGDVLGGRSDVISDESQTSENRRKVMILRILDKQFGEWY